MRYTLYDDAKECTFRPKINSVPGAKKKGKRGGKGGEEKDGSGEDADEANRKQEAESRDAFGFLDRQEAMEREKRQEYTHTPNTFIDLLRTPLTSYQHTDGGYEYQDEYLLLTHLFATLLTHHGSDLRSAHLLTPTNNPFCLFLFVCLMVGLFLFACLFVCLFVPQT